MQVKVNGESRDIADRTTVLQLLQDLKVKPEGVVVEVNLKILKRDEHAKTILSDGDTVEIVQFVGGGQ